MSQVFWQHKLWNFLIHLAGDSVSPEATLDVRNLWKHLHCLEGWAPAERSLEQSLERSPEQALERSQELSQEQLPTHLNTFCHSTVASFTTSGVSSLVDPLGHRLQAFSTPFAIPKEILACSDVQKVFWWFWRCYPQTVPQSLSKLNLSVESGQSLQTGSWSAANVAAALAGATSGYMVTSRDPTSDALNPLAAQSQPYLALFTFASALEYAPISHTFSEVWAEPWLIHYLASKICWKIAWKYGPDAVLSPCLYGQPWIDEGLLQQYPDFQPWIAVPPARSQIWATCPNTLVAILPNNGMEPTASKGNPVLAAMLYAEQVLRQEWMALGQQVLADLQQRDAAWQSIDRWLWQGWLEAEWQSQWVALPIDEFNSTSIDLPIAQTAQTAQTASHPIPQQLPQRNRFIEQAVQHLNAARQVQTWKIPTVFASRSTYSGVGPNVSSVDSSRCHSGRTEKLDRTSQKNRSVTASLVSLNPTEAVKRELVNVLPHLLQGVDASQFLNPPCGQSAPTDWYVLARSYRDPGDSLSPYDSIEAELTAFTDLQRRLLDFSGHLAPYLTEQRYAGQLLQSHNGDVLAWVPLLEWDHWVWDMRQCFRGAEDPEIERLQSGLKLHAKSQGYFHQEGEYWCWQGDTKVLSTQPFLTLGHQATLRFEVVIAPRSVPLSIALDTNLLREFAAASPPFRLQNCEDGIQVYVLEKDGCAFTTSASLDVFRQWQLLLNAHPTLSPSWFEDAAHLWHCEPPLNQDDIHAWVDRFCQQSSLVRDHPSISSIIHSALFRFILSFWRMPQSDMSDRQIQNWLRLAALSLRHRYTATNTATIDQG